MKFIPNGRKYQKIFKLRPKKINLIEHKLTKLSYGQYGIKAISCGLLTTKHFVLLRMLIKRNIKKQAKFYFPKRPYVFTTKKPLEVRMGKGKGAFDKWVCPIKIGQILLEFKFSKTIKLKKRLQILRKCIKRLPMKTIIVSGKIKKVSQNFYKNYKYLTYGLY